MTSFADLHALFAKHGQAHIFRHWASLSEREREQLLADCAKVDFAWMAARIQQMQEASSPRSAAFADLTPAPVVRLPRNAQEKAAAKKARAIGEEALRAGRVAALVVTGGQGTRLGCDGPKGCYPLGPVSGKTLFQWHAEQILAVCRRYGTKIPWYIMTSLDNDAATRAYFEANAYLGFPAEDIRFFTQSMVPSLDENRHLLLATKCRLAMNPDGHGGTLAAMVRSGALADMQQRRIDLISYFQVDNPLIAICDPLFIGHHLAAGAEMSVKVVAKRTPAEKVGHLCQQHGRATVIEYSEMPTALMEERDSLGGLRFWAGSIGVHLFDVAFIERVAASSTLPWHMARKKINFWADGANHRPAKPNGIKFETFIFDALPLARRSLALEVQREEEFAPLKNAAGEDSIETCRRMISARFARWLAAAGIKTPRAADGSLAAMIEISPLYALDAAELKKKIKGRIMVERMLALG